MIALKLKYYTGEQIRRIITETISDYDTVMTLLGKFADEPSAEPDRKTGKWIYIRTDSDGNAWYECPFCHRSETHVPIVDVAYCWNCGARMEGDAGE